jgi:5'-nucleotidase
MRSAKQFLLGSLGAALALSGMTALMAPSAHAVTGVFVSEFHYDDNTTNDAGGIGEFVEVTAPAGTDLTGWKVQLVNGNGNAVYRTDTLAGVVTDQQGGWGTMVVAYPVAAGGSFQNGSPDGLALINASGGVVEFISYEGAMTASLGTPPVTVNSVDTGGLAVEGSATPGTDTLQRQTDGSWAAPAANTRGMPNGFTSNNPGPVTATDPGDKTFTQNQAITPITLQASGGSGTYSWAVTNGVLPAGLDLVGNQIAGTPTATTGGPVEITVTASDTSDPVQTAAATFTITVNEPLTITPIAELQGTGARSPFAGADNNQGAETKATEGVVTAAYYTGGFNGIYIQTPGVDTANASDGIFVYGGSTNANIPAGIQVGDSVRVTGKIAEFFNLTQIVPGAAGVEVLPSSLGTVTPRTFTYPTSDAERETYEGELVAPQGTFTISNVYATNQYGEIGLASGEGPLKQPSEYADATNNAALQAIKEENAGRALVLDDGATTNYLQNQTTKALPLPWLTGADGNAVASPPRVGASVDFHQPVILDYRNDVWKVQPQAQVVKNGAAVATFEDTRAQNLHPADVLKATGDVKIATFNVLNYFNTTGEAYSAAGPQQNPPLDTFCTYYTDRGPGTSQKISNNSCGVRLLDDPSTPANESNGNDGRGPRGAATDVSLARQEEKLAHAIVDMGADVIGLEEVENSIKLPGETNRDDALARIVQLLNAIEGAGTWKYVKSPGEATTAAAVGEQDTIRPALIYKPAAVTPVGQSDILFGTDEFANAREPLAQAFKKAGAPDSDAFALIVNHFKSKGDNASPNPPATGDNANNDDTGAFNGDRKRQAARLVQFADDFAAERDIDAVFLAGDFNSYSEEEPVGIIETGGYTAIESDTDNEESYSHSGLSGSLDHVFANAAGQAMVTGADIWEINANEPISYEYSRYNYNVTDLWQPNLPFATSDHNPEVLGLNLPDTTAPAYDEVQVIGTNDFHGRLLPDGGNAAGAAPFASAVKELREENPNTVFVAAGDLVGASTFESFIQQDEPTIDALNAMGLEVSAAGNHEFDKSYADFEGRIRDRANWEYIASNLEYDDSIAPADRLAETWVKDMDGKRIGFVGAVTEDLPALVNPAGIDGITVTDIVDAANAAAASLRSASNPGGPVDLVVLLVHEGAPTADCSAGTNASTTWGNIVQNASSDVDAIISGHTHLAYNCTYPVADWNGRAVTKRPVVSAGQYGTNLNKLVFKFAAGTDDLMAISQDVIATAGVGYAPEPSVQAIVTAAKDYADTAGAQVLGQMTGPFKRARYTSSAGATENRGGESTLGNQIAEIQRWATDAAGIDTDIAFMNPGGLRADMDGTDTGSVNDLTYRQAADVQPFANTLVNMKLTGAQIEQVLEEQWQRNAQGGVPSRPFLRLGVSKGFTYTYVEKPVTISAPNAAPVNTFQGEVTGMWLDGEPVDAAHVYSVTVNSFLGEGGDNFWELADGAEKVDTGKVDLEAMVDYMKQYDTEALPVDYSQRGVALTLPDAAPSTYHGGDQVTFDIASWAMSADEDQHDTELQVKLGGTVLGSFPVDNARGTAPYDRTGTAHVTVTLPADVADGTTTLTVHGPTTKTSVPLVLATEDGLTDIQIVGTNDFHGRIQNDPASASAGAAVMSTAVKELRQANPNTVFAAAGDLIGASTFESFVSNDKPTIDALNAAGLEVSAVGNHELDQGYDDLMNRVMAAYDPATNPDGGAQWQYIASNLRVRATGDPAVPASWVKTMDGVDVGFVGAVTEALPTLVSPDGIADIEVEDIVDSVNAEANRLANDEDVDLVVMLVHEGAPSTDCATMDDSGPWAEIVNSITPNVDAIVSGHTHLAYNCSFPVAEWADRPVKERPVVSAGQYGEKLNKLVFSVDRSTGDVQAQTQQVLNLKTCNNSTTCTPYTPDPAVAQIVQDAVDVATPIGNQVLGPIQGPFNRAKRADGTTENRGGESTLGNLVAEVQRAETPQEQGGAQIAFMNPGGLRADMAGTLTGDTRNLTYRQAAAVQPFANGLVNMDLTGAQIEKVLEQQWSRTPDGTQIPAGLTRYFLRLGVSKGFTYTYREVPAPAVPVQGGGPAVDTWVGDVTGMWLNGVPIDPAQTYSVTVNAFLAGGGDSFWELKNGQGQAQWGVTDLQAMTHYMSTHTQIGGAALPVDYSQRAVEVHDVADGYPLGGRLTFGVESWSLSNATDAKDTQIEVRIGDDLLGTATLDNTVGTAAIDKTGRASIDVPLPADTPLGQVEVTLTGATTGTEVPVLVDVVAGTFVNDTKPVITGTAKVGSQLSASAGTWTPTPGSVSYQWSAAGVEIGGATSATYTLTAAEAGKTITVAVTAKADGYDDKTVVSDPTGAVEAAVIVNTAVPVVSGTPRVGRTLTATSGTWTPTPTSVSFQWYANGAPIAGATGPSLVLGAAQVGTRVTVAATAHATGFADATAVSAQVGPVAQGSVALTVKTTPKKIKVGKTKTKVIVSVTTADGVPVTGQVTIKAKGQKAKTVTVVNGQAKVTLKAFGSVGAKSIKVSYLGSPALAPAQTTTTVWVVRR